MVTPKKKPPKRPPKKKPTKRPPKKKPPKKGALVHFTAEQKVSARLKPRADDPDGGTVWLLIQPISWWKSKTKGVSLKTKLAAIKALKKFKKR